MLLHCLANFHFINMLFSKCNEADFVKRELVWCRVKIVIPVVEIKSRNHDWMRVNPKGCNNMYVLIRFLRVQYVYVSWKRLSRFCVFSLRKGADWEGERVASQATVFWNINRNFELLETASKLDTIKIISCDLSVCRFVIRLWAYLIGQNLQS